MSYNGSYASTGSSEGSSGASSMASSMASRSGTTGNNSAFESFTSLVQSTENSYTSLSSKYENDSQEADWHENELFTEDAIREGPIQPGQTARNIKREAFRNVIKKYPKFLSKQQTEKHIETDEISATRYWYGPFDYRLFTLLTVVGIRNMLYFPLQVAKHGAAPCLIAYSVIIMLVGYPMILLEAGLGQCISRGPGGCWNFARLFIGLGLVQIFQCFVSMNRSTFYSLQCLYFFIEFLSNGYPWEVENCIHFKTLFSLFRVDPAIDSATRASNCMAPNGTKSDKAEDAASESNMYMIVAFIVNWIVGTLFLFPDIRIRGRIGSGVFLSSAFMACLLCLRSMALPGAMKGIQFAFANRAGGSLLDPDLWLIMSEACVYSLIMQSGYHMTIARYNHFNNNIVFDVLFIVLVDCLLNIVGILLTFSLLGYLDEEKGMSLDGLHKKPGLQLFLIQLPYALSSVDSGFPWAAMYILLTVVMVQCTTTGEMEVVVTGIIDLFHLNTNKRQKVVSYVCVFSIILTTWTLTKVAVLIFLELDRFVIIIPSGFISFMIAFAIAWVYGVDKFIALIECSVGWCTTEVLSHPKFKLWWKVCWKYVSPGMFSIIIILRSYKLIGQKHKYMFFWVRFIGPTMWTMFFLIIFGTMAFLMARTNRGGFKDRLKYLTSPIPEWGPALAQNRAIMNIGETDRLKAEDDPSKQTTHQPVKYADLRF